MPFRISSLNSSVIRKRWEILTTDMNSEEGVSEEDALKVKKPSWQKPIVEKVGQHFSSHQKSTSKEANEKEGVR